MFAFKNNQLNSRTKKLMTRKGVSFEEQIFFKNKYTSIFLRK